MKHIASLLVKALLLAFGLTSPVLAQDSFTHGLVAYYPMNGTGDDGAGRNPLVLSNVIYGTDRLGNPHGCMEFDGDISRWCKSQDLVAPSVVDNFSMTIWAKPGAILDTDTRQESLVVMATHGLIAYGPGHAGVGILAGTNGVSVWEHSHDYVRQAVTVMTNVSEWTQIVVVYSNRVPFVYLNGQCAGVGAANASYHYHPSSGQTITPEQFFVPEYGGLGLFAMNYSGWDYSAYQGAIDDFRIYDHALSPAEIQQLYAFEARQESLPAPTITAQPQPIKVNALNSASFSVTAAGALPLKYQWSLNGTNIAGATSSSLTIFSVMQQDLGDYAVVVTNSFGTATSANATLSMYPFIRTPFSGAITYWGKGATFGVQAWGTGPLTYQWYKDGTTLPGATQQEWTLASIQFTNAGLYSVVVSNPLGSVTNSPAQVVVNPAGVSLGLYPGVTVSGVVGYTYEIQATPDLTDTNSWSPIGTLTLTQPVQLWVDVNTDTTSPTNTHRFYRVVPGR